jgi:hypothetical protein
MADDNFLSTLPALFEGAPQRNVPVPFDVYRASGTMPETEAEAPSVPLSHYLWIFRRNWWKILLFVGCPVAATAVISMRLTPVFESTVTIDIDRQMPMGIIGQESTRSFSNDSDQFLATQGRLIQSDSVLRPVAQQFKLSPDAEAQEGQNQRPPGVDDDTRVTQERANLAGPGGAKTPSRLGTSRLRPFRRSWRLRSFRRSWRLRSFRRSSRRTPGPPG